MDELAYILQSEYKEHGLLISMAAVMGASYFASLVINIVAERFAVGGKALFVQLLLPYALWLTYVSFAVVLMVFFPDVWATQSIGPEWFVIGLIVSGMFAVVLGGVWQVGVYASYKTVKLFSKKMS